MVQISQGANTDLAMGAQVYKFPLDEAHTAGYSEIAAETTAAGFGDPTLKADDDRHMAVFFRLYTTHASNLWAGDGGDTREGMPDALSAGSPTLSFARPPRLATGGGSITQGLGMTTINPSISSDPASSRQNKKRPGALPVDFDRIDPKLSEFVGAESAVDRLNLHFMAFNGINAIARLLRANVVARECAEPSMDGSLTDGLLAAAIALSRLAADEIEHLADWADDRASEVRHG